MSAVEQATEATEQATGHEAIIFRSNRTNGEKSRPTVVGAGFMYDRLRSAG